MEANSIQRVICNKSYSKKLAESNTALLTLFTPSYNRAKFLPRLKECMDRQTCRNFVWIIVNDGSKDDTEVVVEEIMKMEDLPIKFISKPNGGKHSAFKAAFEQCETAYFQCMDDDDIYSPEAVGFFLNKWDEINKEGANDIGAIRTLSKHPDGTYSTNFTVIEGEEYDASTIETNYVMRRRQENWTCYDAAKLRSVDLFKEYWMCEQHKFVTESIWQTRFARKYKCRYINQSFREYRNDDELSLMRRPKSRQAYLDMFLNDKVTLDEQLDLIRLYDHKSLLRRVMRVNCLRCYLEIPFRVLQKHTESRYLRNLYRLTWAISLFGNIIVKKRYS